MTIIDLRKRVQKACEKEGIKSPRFYVQCQAWNDDEKQKLSVHVYNINRTFEAETSSELIAMISAGINAKAEELEL